VWINMIAIEPIVPSHYILLHLLLQIVDVFHMRHGNIISQF
jgi:hypothetical protein